MNRKQRRTAAKQNRSTEKKLSLADAVSYAIQLHQKGQLDEAEKIYQQVLDVNPEFPDALHFLGVLAHQKGLHDDAIALISKAVHFNSNYSDAYNNLGNVFKETGKLDEAEQAYQSCLAIDSKNINAMSNLGAVLRENEKYTEALEVLERAILLAPNHSQAYHNLGNVLKKLNRLEEAITAYRKSIELLHSNDSKAHVSAVYKSLSRALFIERNFEKATVVLKQWLEFDPSSATAAHMLSACTGENVPGRASDSFVEETFDNFAGSFDEILKKLNYQAPELVLSAVKAQIEHADKQLRILDAGCGTGLCGVLLDAYASHLIGVDLSKGMVDKARGRDIYNDLIVAELTEYIQKQVGEFDLIVSADTLCYFGDLGEVIFAMSGALKKQGLLVFTLEKIIPAESEVSYQLNPHGRYSHAQIYVDNILINAGFQVLSIAIETLRNEGGKPVIGMVVTAIKC